MLTVLSLHCCVQTFCSYGIQASHCWAQTLAHMGSVACPIACGILVYPTRDWTCVPSFGRWILNHCTTREVPYLCFFNMLSRFVIAFLPRSKHLLISWLQSLSSWFLSPRKQVSHCFHCFSICLPWSDKTGCHDLHFLSFKPAFSLSSFRGSLIILHFLP